MNQENHMQITKVGDKKERSKFKISYVLETTNSKLVTHNFRKKISTNQYFHEILIIQVSTDQYSYETLLYRTKNSKFQKQLLVKQKHKF